MKLRSRSNGSVFYFHVLSTCFSMNCKRSAIKFKQLCFRYGVCRVEHYVFKKYYYFKFVLLRRVKKDEGEDVINEQFFLYHGLAIDGLDDQVKKLRVYSFADEKCSVCLRRLWISGRIVFLGCMHCLHTKCFENGINSALVKCPVCRAPITCVVEKWEW